MNTALAGMSPLELVAGMHLEVYERVIDMKRRGTPITTKTLDTIKHRARQKLHQRWVGWLSSAECEREEMTEAI